jgi:hypothetical protein
MHPDDEQTVNKTLLADGSCLLHDCRVFRGEYVGETTVQKLNKTCGLSSCTTSSGRRNYKLQACRLTME